MTNRDAIEILQRNIPGCDYDLSEAVTLAISALEKQIPKRKLEKDQDNENLFTLRCPTCGELIGNYNKRLDRFSYMVKKTIVTSAGKRLILANHSGRSRMDNREAINWLTRIRDRLMTTRSKQFEAMTMAIAAMEKQEKAYGEWCTDCKEYDHNRNCCPRFNRVIRGALDEVKKQG